MKINGKITDFKLFGIIINTPFSEESVIPPDIPDLPSDLPFFED